jgi:hypothetical protein
LLYFHRRECTPWDLSKKRNLEHLPVRTSINLGPTPIPVQTVLLDKPIAKNLFNAVDELAARIQEVPRELVKSTLHECIPVGSFVPREGLLRDVCKKLGYSKLGRNIRSTINRTIGAEVRAGRLGTDWQNVWWTVRDSNKTV